MIRYDYIDCKKRSFYSLQSLRTRLCRLKSFLLCVFLILSWVYLPNCFGQAGSREDSKTYRVWVWQENKDCLWKIAERFYGDGRKWTIIYEAKIDYTVILLKNKQYLMFF